MFDGDWYLALASYNAGPGRLQGAVQRSKTTDFWKITATTRYLPRETREYVPMILAAIIIARNPELYGFEVNSAAPLAYETVDSPERARSEDHRRVGGRDRSKHLQDLNPELRRTTTPMTPHELKVPVGTAAPIQARLADGRVAVSLVQVPHRQARRDPHDDRAEVQHHADELRDANDLRPRQGCAPNQSLMIPAAPGRRRCRRRARRDGAATLHASDRDFGAEDISRPAGDTLFSIARQFSTSRWPTSSA